MTDRRKINEQELQYLFTLIGQGVWRIQDVESALTACIAIKGEIKEIGAVNLEMGKAILEKHQRNTLGTSIRIATEKNVLSTQLMTALINFKDERDWLVHRSNIQNGDDLYQNSTRQDLFNRLERFSENASNIQRLITNEILEFAVEKGISRNWIENYAAKEIAKKEGRNT